MSKSADTQVDFCHLSVSFRPTGKRNGPGGQPIVPQAAGCSFVCVCVSVERIGF